ncbi:MAG: protein translocase SEC61 complex subunit gamma [Nanoarchaeota archaeon]
MTLQSFIEECRRVPRITKKPTKDEFRVTVKVAGLGIALIGFIGFVLAMIKTLIT